LNKYFPNENHTFRTKRPIFLNGPSKQFLLYAIPTHNTDEEDARKYAEYVSHDSNNQAAHALKRAKARQELVERMKQNMAHAEPALSVPIVEEQESTNSADNDNGVTREPSLIIEDIMATVAAAAAVADSASSAAAAAAAAAMGPPAPKRAKLSSVLFTEDI
jgi:Mrp family chromosome partitioning ATPase